MVRAKEVPERIDDWGPVSPDKRSVAGIRVCVRSNSGEDIELIVECLETANAAAKAARATSNHMVCIEVDGQRVKRWERDRVVGENRWRKVDPEEMEVLGQIREVVKA